MDNRNGDISINYVNEAEESPQKSMPEKLELREIPLDKIKISEFCQRDDAEEDLNVLAESIEQHGLLQFPTVMDDGDGYFTLIFGSRRYLAYKCLRRQTIPCYVKNVSLRGAAYLSIIENSVRKNRHPVEEARILKQIKDQYDLTDTELAEEIGWPQSVVAERLAITKLPDDVLEKVDTRPESPFKFSHALALAKLWETGRHNREMEVRELQNKTITHGLSSNELKELVGLFKDGRFELLPDKLRTYLLKAKSMTVAVAKLYLTPDTVILGDDNQSQRLREVAQRISKKELENLIVKAVKAEWSLEKFKQQLLNMIKGKAEPAKQQEPKSSCQKLLGDISIMDSRLDACIAEVPDLAKSNPGQLDWLCREVKRLRSKLEDFLKATMNAVNESR
jgi:ParB/RepB/Spo0J family partition protein